MLSANNITLQYGKRVLFDEVNIKFNGDNCYGVIGANGAGKSTFLKILSGEIDANKGNISMEPGKRMAVLTQNHSEYDDFRVIDAVMVGHKNLWEVMKEKNAIYAKADFSEQDGIKAAELEEEFAEMDGWNAEPDAAASAAASRSCRASLMLAPSEMVEPVKVPKPVAFSATPVKLMRSSTLPSISVTTAEVALVSTAVSSSWRAAFRVLLSVIVEPVKVPRLALSLATPVRVATLSM